MFLKTEKILIPVLCLAMAGLGLWGHAILPRDMGLAVLPGLAVVLMIALLWIVPAVMPRSASLDRSEAAYGATLLATFMLLTVTQATLVLVAQGVAIDHVRIMAAGVGLLLIVIGNYLPKTRRNYAMGVRTPWALADERVWDKTHRLAGPLFMLGGFAAVAGAVFGPPQTHFAVLVIASLAPAVVSYIYSYLVARRLNLT